jgi:methyltransferase family protein
MNWKLKSLVQRTCAAVPFGRDDLYYGLQKTVGRARVQNPLEYFREAAAMVAELTEAGLPIQGARVMEVGTGLALDMPIAFYLCGAASVTTLDLNRYLRAERVSGTLAFIRAEAVAVRQALGEGAGPEMLEERLATLAGITTLTELLRRVPIVYRAPADAAHTHLPGRSIDAQVSFTVFEHIPAETLAGILVESTRLLAPSGLALHHVDLSDHFSHDDARISAINFLRFSEREWRGYAGNQFAYHNRLRAHEYRALYARSGHDILGWAPSVNEGALRTLTQGFPLAPEYRGMPPEELCISQIRILSRPAEGRGA